MNNNIGTAFAIVQEIAEELGWNYSHGNLTEMGFKAVTVYPLTHLTIQTVQLNDYVSTIQMNVIIADIVNFLKGENEQESLITLYSEQGYTENQNYAHILQDLYVKFSLKLREKEMQYNQSIMIQKPIAFVPFIESDKDVLAGYNITINMDVQSPWVTDCYNEV